MGRKREKTMWGKGRLFTLEERVRMIIYLYNDLIDHLFLYHLFAIVYKSIGQEEGEDKGGEG